MTDSDEALFSGDYETVQRFSVSVENAEVDNAACRWCQEEYEGAAGESTHECSERARWEAARRTDLDCGSTIEPAIHEIGAKLLFADREHGMSPYFAFVSEFDRCLQDTYEGENGAMVSQGDDIGTFEAAGEEWQLNHDEEKVKYWQGSIATRDGDSGDAYYEYNVGLVATDAVGRKRVNVQIRPSLPNATHVESGDLIQSLPDDLPEGVRVQVDSANVPRDQLIDVVKGFVDAMGIQPYYFAREHLHEWSRVYNYALYVRAIRDLVEQQVVAQTGLLERLATFASQRGGSGEYKWDNEEVFGHRHAVAMNPTGLGKLLPDQTVGKLLKSYRRKDPAKHRRPSDPTTDPKIEVQFSTEYSEEYSIPWDASDEFDADDLHQELDEYLVTMLDWAGLPTVADDNVYVDDAYWDVQETDREISVYPDPIHELREVEEGLAMHHFAADDVSPGERSVVQALADGGPMHYERLAEETETSSSTVYRAMETFDDVLQTANGVLDFADEFMREKFEDLFGMLADAAEWVEDGIEAVRDGDELLAADSAFAQWARRYGATVSGDHDGLEITLNAGTYSRYEIQQALRSGYVAARETGPKIADQFLDAVVTFTHSEKGVVEGDAAVVRGNKIAFWGAPLEDIG